jgi:hypothetical protein
VHPPRNDRVSLVASSQVSYNWAESIKMRRWLSVISRGGSGFSFILTILTFEGKPTVPFAFSFKLSKSQYEGKRH